MRAPSMHHKFDELYEGMVEVCEKGKHSKQDIASAAICIFIETLISECYGKEPYSKEKILERVGKAYDILKPEDNPIFHKRKLVEDLLKGYHQR